MSFGGHHIIFPLLDRTTMIDSGNFLKPRDRLAEFDCHSVDAAGCTCEKETEGTLKRMERPHHVITIPLNDISIRHVHVEVVCVGAVILHAFPDLLQLQEVEVKAVVEE
jgi:hypothetical protein